MGDKTKHGVFHYSQLVLAPGVRFRCPECSLEATASRPISRCFVCPVCRGVTVAYGASYERGPWMLPIDEERG
jgi:hypothetical protein